MVTTIADILPQAALKHGDRVALIINSQRWSFRELDALSNRVANGLVASGVEPGDRVGLFGPNCWEWLVSYYGIAKAGAVVNPLSSMLTADEVQYAVTDTAARAVIASPDKAQVLQDVKAGGARFELVVWDEAPVAGATLLRQWLADASPEFVARPRLPSDLAAICYTSGTTGRPKGAMQSQRAVVGAGVGTALMAARTAEDRVVSALPLFHVYGSCVMNAAMMVGSTLIVIPRFNEVVVLGAIAEHRATIMDGVPTMYLYMLSYPDFAKYDLSSLRTGVMAGSPSSTAPSFAAESALKRWPPP